MADRGGALFQTLELIKKCADVRPRAGSTKMMGNKLWDAKVQTSATPQTAANLGLHSVTRGVSRSLPPHCGLLRKDPLKS